MKLESPIRAFSTFLKKVKAMLLFTASVGAPLHAQSAFTGEYFLEADPRVGQGMSFTTDDADGNWSASAFNKNMPARYAASFVE